MGDGVAEADGSGVRPGVSGEGAKEGNDDGAKVGTATAPSFEQTSVVAGMLVLTLPPFQTQYSGLHRTSGMLA